ncbi:MAG: hypothetical protein IPK13_08875 [Deltaproteobacteria bacterium]|nr:hypothetical protein [Deltaproteobacteria bacterium]
MPWPKGRTLERLVLISRCRHDPNKSNGNGNGNGIGNSTGNGNGKDRIQDNLPRIVDRTPAFHPAFRARAPKSAPICPRGVAGSSDSRTPKSSA